MKNFLNFLKTPPRWFVIIIFLLTTLCAVSTILLFVFNLHAQIYAYALYALSAILLAYTLYLLICIVKSKAHMLAEKSVFLKKLLKDYKFRTQIFTYFSLAINILFALFEITMSFVSRSIWYGSLGCYYLVLSMTRLGILIGIKKRKTTAGSGLLTYQNTGICILVLNLALGGAIVQMMLSQKAFSYVGLMIYAMAFYAFWKITIAIINAQKVKKFDDYSVRSLKSLNLSDAIISLYALQTALIATFGEEDAGAMKYMNIASGVVVIGAMLLLGALMIIKSRKERKFLKENENAEEI